MKIGIHQREHSFSNDWIKYCEENNIDYKIVNAYDSDIVEQLSDCDAFMWHFNHSFYKDLLFAKQLLYSLEIAGKKVFPNYNTCWHFDDKVGQKYFLEAIKAPIVKSYSFYNKSDAKKWIDNVELPLVFKLTGGAGSSNVQLVKNYNQAHWLINKAFGRGFSQLNRWGQLRERFRLVKEKKKNILTFLKGFYILLFGTEFSKMFKKEKGYVYFQEFIPNNNFDIRIIVVGDRAFAIKRMTRENDFRASGSGNILYAKDEFDERCIRIAFDVNDKIKAQSIAYDFVFDVNNNPLIIEISYGYDKRVYIDCPGFWDRNLVWHQGKFSSTKWIVEDLIKSILK